MAQHRWRPQMTQTERRRGFVFFALYLLVFPYLNALAQRFLMGDGEPLVAETNVIYHGVLFLLALAVFWTFLRHGFSLLLDRLPENGFAFVTGLVGAGALHILVMLLPYPVANPMYTDYAQQFFLAPAATVFLLVVLIPVLEEILFRGLLFGALRQYSRPLAYVVTVLFYALACVWRYALDFGDPRYLLLCVQYLPMSLALTWCYDHGGSVWGAAALHMALNGALLFSLVH